LGPYPLVDGLRYPEDTGYSEVNLDVDYAFDRHFKIQLGLFNALNSKANAAAYFYTSRLPNEAASGVVDYQIHRLEPRSARLTLTAAL